MAKSTIELIQVALQATMEDKTLSQPWKNHAASHFRSAYGLVVVANGDAPVLKKEDAHSGLETDVCICKPGMRDRNCPAHMAQV